MRTSELHKHVLTHISKNKRRISMHGGPDITKLQKCRRHRSPQSRIPQNQFYAQLGIILCLFKMDARIHCIKSSRITTVCSLQMTRCTEQNGIPRPDYVKLSQCMRRNRKSVKLFQVLFLTVVAKSGCRQA